MTPRQIIDHYGTQSNAAKALGITRAIVSYWLKQNKVPPKTQAWIQVKTNNALKATGL